MESLIPRMQVFEIDDQPWFPAFLRIHVQNSLTAVWEIKTPLQSQSAASLAASILTQRIGSSLSSYTFVDFCAGSGGPTPSIARAVNARLHESNSEPVRFILTDLHPNIEAWKHVVRKNPFVTYEGTSVDASAAPEHLFRRGDGTKTFRLFNLAFHHFDDHLAKAILRNTVETSDGFAIFELQNRNLASFLSLAILSLGVLLYTPIYAWKWRSPTALIFSWLIPILPFVIVFDGYMSALRTRTHDELEALLQSCGADASEWEMKSGSNPFMWPCGYLYWTVCKPIRRP